MTESNGVKIGVLAFMLVVFSGLIGAAVVVVNGNSPVRLPASTSRIEETARDSFRRMSIPTRSATVKTVAVDDGWDAYFYFPGGDGSYAKWKVHVIENRGEYQGGTPEVVSYVYD